MTDPTTPADGRDGRRPPFPLTRWDLLVAAAAAAFVLVWWNRYLSPTVGPGYELFIARGFEADRLPYRDYYFPLPPSYLLWCTAVVSAFGPHIVWFWVAGGAARLLAAWVLYRWLLRVSAPWAAATATVTAFVATAADVCDNLGWYNIYPPLLAAFLGYCLTRRLESPGPRGGGWVLAGGVLFGVNVLTKQTAGVFVGGAAAAAVGYATWRLRGPRAAALDLVGYAAAAAVPCLAVIAWLWSAGVLGPYVEQVYVKGPASKGGLGQALIRPIWMTYHYPWFRGTALTAVGVLAVIGLARSSGRPRWMIPAAVAAVAAAVVTTGVPATEYLCDTRFPSIVAIYSTSMASVWIAGRALADSVARQDAPVMHRGLMGAVSASLAFALAMSWPACEPMLYPGLAVGLALGLGLDGTVAPGLRLRYVLIGCCVVLTVLAAGRKLLLPSIWGGWTEPPVFAGTVEPAVPALWGFRVSPETARFYEEAVEVIESRTRPGDTVLTYPNLPGVYGLTDRPPAAFCVMHWIDVCPDYVAAEDAARILRAPPKVIVYLEQSENDLSFYEEVFRHGKPSGQRALIAAIKSLLPGYERVAAFGPPRAESPITIYVRKDPPADH